MDGLELDPLAETVYLAMVANPAWTQQQIADDLGVLRESVDSALDRLADLMLLRRSLEKEAGMLDVVSPAVGLHGLLQRQQAEMARRYERFMENQTLVARLLDEYYARRAEGAQRIERLEGMAEVQAKIEELAGRAKSQFLALVPGGGQRPESILASRPVDEAMIARGVAMRSIYLDSLRNDPRTLEHANWLVKTGVSLRTLPSLPLRLLLVDRCAALLPIDPDNSAAGAIYICEPGVIAALLALFEHLWHAALPFGMTESTDDSKPGRQERELLHLLAQGATDEVAARRLGVSVRTVRRMVSGLMDRLGARSRFEAGLRAAERGWVAVAPGRAG